MTRALRDRICPNVGEPIEVVRQIEVRAVQEIEHFGAKLQTRAAGQRHLLQQRQIDVLIAGTLENIPAGISERAETPASRTRPC